MTKYVILARNNDGCWIEGPTMEAANPEAAIRSGLDGDSTSKTFVAVPERSWKPISVRVETVKKVHLAASTAPVAAKDLAAAE